MDARLPSKITLPSGGTVEFVDIDDLTGADVDKIRDAIRREDTSGQTAAAMLKAAIITTVKTWDISYLADPRTPEANPAVLRKLSFRDRLALERAVQPLLLMISDQAELELDETPGSPTPPDSE